MAIISVIIVLIVIMLMFKGGKMKALMTNLAMIKGIKALMENLMENLKNDNNYEYWIIIAWLSLIFLGIMFLTIERMYKMPFF